MGDLALEVTFTHDGGRVVAGDFAGQLQVWNSEDGQQAGTLTTSPADASQPPAKTAE
jgi:hypothetical protein